MNNLDTKIRLVLLMVCLLGSSSCATEVDPQTNSVGSNSSEISIKTANKIEHKPDLEETKGSDWRTQLRLPAKFEIKKIFFLSKDLGWVCNLKTMWKTSDGGQSWKTYKLPPNSGTNVKLLKFVSAQEGWMIVEKFSVTGYLPPSKFLIYHSVDGGGTWQLSDEIQEAIYVASYFKTGVGWIFASKLTAENNLAFLPILLKLDNDSSRWIDRSEALTRKLESFRKGDFPIVLPEVLTLTDEKCLIVVNKELQLFQSCDNGNNWESFAPELTKDYEGATEYLITDVKTCDKVLWIARATGGVHGTRSIIYHSDIGGLRTTAINLPNVFLSKIICDSGSKVHLSGVEGPNGLPQTGVQISLDLDGRKKEIIMRSNNHIIDSHFFSVEGTSWFLDERGQVFTATRPN